MSARAALLRRGVLLAGWILAVVAPASAADVPAIKSVCVEQTPGVQTLSQSRYLYQLLSGNGVADGDLDTTIDTPITTAIRLKALTDPNYCRETKNCDASVPAKLLAARNQAMRFLYSVAMGKQGQYSTTAHPSDQFQALSMFEAGSYPVTCHSAAPTSGPSKDLSGVTIMVRSSADDLFADPKKFAGLSPATFGFDHNGVAHTDTYSSTIVTGLSLGTVYGASPGDSLNFIPFLQYNLKSVNATPPKAGTIDNLGAGFMFAGFYKAFGFYQSLTVYPLYTRSLYDSSETFTSAATWMPEPGWLGLDEYRELGNFGAFNLQPVISLAYVTVLTAGSNVALAASRDGFRIGPGADFHFIGAPATLLDRFSLGASYRYYAGTEGKPIDITNFTGTVSYALVRTASSSISITLKYVGGRDLQSLVQQNDTTIGVGFKF